MILVKKIQSFIFGLIFEGLTFMKGMYMVEKREKLKKQIDT